MNSLTLEECHSKVSGIPLFTQYEHMDASAAATSTRTSTEKSGSLSYSIKLHDRWHVWEVKLQTVAMLPARASH